MRPWDGCVCGVGGPATSYGGPDPPPPHATVPPPPPGWVTQVPPGKQGYTTRPQCVYSPSVPSDGAGSSGTISNASCRAKLGLDA